MLKQALQDLMDSVTSRYSVTITLERGYSDNLDGSITITDREGVENSMDEIFSDAESLESAAIATLETLENIKREGN